MRKILYNPLTALIIFLVIIGFWFSLYRTRQSIRNSTQNITVLQEKVDQTESEVANLEEKLAQAEDDFTRERIARDEFLLQQPGDIVVKVELDEVAIEEEPVITQSDPLEEWWELLRN